MKANGGISAQIELSNQIITLIQNTTKEADFAALCIDQSAKQFLALTRESAHRLADGETAADLSRPKSPIARSSLFTGGTREPQLHDELKKEIASADRIDLLVSFIRWTGLNLLMEGLCKFTGNGGELRIITTTYMGATQPDAIGWLRMLPNTKVTISHNTADMRLHAKAYIFHRNTGFTAAYVGSSNLSSAALTDGLE